MIKQHIMMKAGQAYLADFPHLKARIVAQMHIKGAVPIEAVAEHYGISLADVYASIAYYYDNQDKIEESLADKVDTVKKLGKNNFHEVKTDN